MDVLLIYRLPVLTLSGLSIDSTKLSVIKMDQLCTDHLLPELLMFYIGMIFCLDGCQIKKAYIPNHGVFLSSDNIFYKPWSLST